MSFICSVDFRAILLKVNHLIMRNNALCCLVLSAPLYNHLFAKIHRFVEKNQISFSDQVLLFIAKQITTLVNKLNCLYRTLNHFYYNLIITEQLNSSFRILFSSCPFRTSHKLQLCHFQRSSPLFEGLYELAPQSQAIGAFLQLNTLCKRDC